MTAIRLMRRAILAGAAALPATAFAQGAPWPDRPIKVIIPFPPGGPMDMVARMLEQSLPPRLRRQPIVVENRSGGGGAIAMHAAARSAPDGYTVIITTPGPGSVLQSLVPGITYDSPRDFAGVTNMFEIALHALGPHGIAAAELRRCAGRRAASARKAELRHHRHRRHAASRR